MNKELLDLLLDKKVSADDLLEIVNHIKELEVEKARVEAEREEMLIAAREDFLDAMVNYLLLLDVVTPDEVSNVDWDAVMEGLKGFEKELPSFLSLYTKASKPKAKVKIKKYIVNPDGETTKEEKTEEELDQEALSKWLDELFS